jgi:hypothetical protein
VQLLPEPHVAVIYISWDPEELKPPKPLKQLRPKSEIEYKSQLLMNNRKQNDNEYEQSKARFQSSIEYNNQQDFNIPLLKSNSPRDYGTPKSQMTRPSKTEPFYLANLRIF